MTKRSVLPGLVAAARYGLALVFTVYGGVKLAGGQFDYGHWVLDRSTVDPTSLVWAFYGYSPVYGRAVGLFELVPALMLVHRRTATAGAAALFAVSLNVTLMDFAFGFPEVKYYALGYTTLLALLLVYDRKKLALLFRDAEPGHAAPHVRRATSSGRAWRSVLASGG